MMIVAARKVKSCFQCRGLPKISAQADQIHPPVVLVNFGKHPERVVAAAVIHKHELIRLADRVHHFGQLHVQMAECFPVR